MGMTKADILADCIKDELSRFVHVEDRLLRLVEWVDELQDLADPQAEIIRTLEKRIEKLSNPANP
ncbi:hypothetical protein OAP25_02135 [Flavobacteriaceae bacterium]|nr:hypothetical protein [Flavobacteriaceae bacterium]